MLRAAPEQLRIASPREELVESLKGPVELPWTITSLASDPKKRTYHDISAEVPSHEDWIEAHETEPGDPQQEGLPHETSPETLPKSRVTTKRAPQERDGAFSSKELRAGERRGLKRDSSSVDVPGEEKEERRRPIRGVGRHETHEEGDEQMAQTAVEIEIEVPDSKRGLRKFLENPVAYFCQKLKRKQIEVHERHLNPEDRAKFDAAKQIEVKNFVAAECFKAWQGRELREDEIMGMRWLLTWKFDEKYESIGGKKAKARAIILGYQDPMYSTRETSAPTPTRAGRQLFLQFCAWKGFRVKKGDVSGAFLQGDDLQEDMWCRPLPEICRALGVEDGTPMLMRKAAYGLVQAPLHWFRSVCNFLKSLGYVQLKTEPCCWIFKHEGKVKSLIHGHVDDFMFGGSEECDIHQGLMAQIRSRFTWGTWEEKDFVQCGVRVRQHEDGSIDLDQQRSVTELEEIHLVTGQSTTERRPDHGCGEICFAGSPGRTLLGLWTNPLHVLRGCELPHHQCAGEQGGRHPESEPGSPGNEEMAGPPLQDPCLQGSR